MKNVIILVFIIALQIKASGQISREDRLIKAFIDYSTTDEYQDSLTFKVNFQHLDAAIEDAIENENILRYKNFQKLADTLNIMYDVKKSENNNLLLFTMSDANNYHWNYIVENNKIILKENKGYEYYTEIHNLNKAEFLLIEQQDEFVYACNYAYVFRKEANTYKKKKAFGNKTVLTVCNFTEIEMPPPISSENPGHYTLPVRKISFDYKNKIIFYGSCTNPMTRKTSTGKAKYINGNFKIKDCDERKFFD